MRVVTGLVRFCVLFLLPPVALAVDVGERAPEFTLPAIYSDAPPIKLSAYQGKVVYLDFWSSWCAPCRRAMPQLSDLRDIHSRDRFEVVAINVDAVTDDGRQFLKQVPVSYPVAADASGSAAERYGVSALPAAFLIDAQGIVQRVFRGKQVEDFAVISSLVDELTSAAPSTSSQAGVKRGAVASLVGKDR